MTDKNNREYYNNKINVKNKVYNKQILTNHSQPLNK